MLPNVLPTQVKHLSAVEFPNLLEVSKEVYADAYRLADSAEAVAAFAERAMKAQQQEGFTVVTAYSGQTCVGFAFGYPLPAHNSHWWAGLTPRRDKDFSQETGQRTFVVAELAVRCLWQKRGVGHRLHDALLSNRPEERATLACNPEDAHLRALYQHWGWHSVGIVPGTAGEARDRYELFLMMLRAEGQDESAKVIK